MNIRSKNKSNLLNLPSWSTSNLSIINIFVIFFITQEHLEGPKSHKNWLKIIDRRPFDIVLPFFVELNYVSPIVHFISRVQLITISKIKLMRSK